MNEQPNAPQMAPDHQLAKRQSLLILLALSFVAGWFSAIIPPKSNYFPLYQIFVSVCATVFIVRWVALDAVERRFRLTSIWIFLFVFFSFLPVPFYLIFTRGKAAWRPIAALLGLVFGYSFALGIGQLIARSLGL